MPEIRVLPEVLAHKIAAGEVVERPASVVKELLENSLDAASRKIAVEASDGGKQRICVRDDGSGMSPEDARLAFQRHATSKISSMEDLDRITTLGFRGEALPTIASVSRLRLRTIQRNSGESPLGTEVEYAGGDLVGVREVTWPTGTEVTVEDLFYNVPARKKFLKRGPTELSHLSRQVQHYALAYPEVDFRFRSQERIVFEAPAVEALDDRIVQLLGDRFLENLTPVEYETDGVRVRGLTSLPHEQKSNSTGLYLYVNRRMVRDRVLTHAVRLAYRDLIPTTSYPILVLFVEMDPTLLDVNVHPAKTEIRFHRSGSVHRAVYHGIEEALLRHRSHFSHLARPVPSDKIRAASSGLGAPASGGARAFLEHGSRMPGLFAGSAMPGHPSEGQATEVYRPPDPSVVKTGSDPHAGNIPETAHISSIPVVLGQFVESFIVSADREGVLLIDQHVAHERILYDKWLERSQEGARVATQRLLMPMTIELTRQQRTALKGVLDELNSNGFEVDWFGESTIVIKGVPHFAKDCEVERLIEQVLDDLGGGHREVDTSGAAVHRLRQKVAVSLACRAAIKINTPLSKEKMQWLLDELFACSNPYTCPHGRPVVLRMGIGDVLRGFKRI